MSSPTGGMMGGRGKKGKIKGMWKGNLNCDVEKKKKRGRDRKILDEVGEQKLKLTKWIYIFIPWKRIEIWIWRREYLRISLGHDGERMKGARWKKGLECRSRGSILVENELGKIWVWNKRWRQRWKLRENGWIKWCYDVQVLMKMSEKNSSAKKSRVAVVQD